MRRRAWSGLALAVIMAISTVTGLLAAPAGASPSASRPSAASFCTTMEHFLDFVRSAPRPSALRTARGRALMADLRTTAPRPVAGAAKTLTRSLEHVAAHGRHSLSEREHAAANASLLAAARFAVDHCTRKRVTRGYASILASAEPTSGAQDV